MHTSEGAQNSLSAHELQPLSGQLPSLVVLCLVEETWAFVIRILEVGQNESGVHVAKGASVNGEHVELANDELDCLRGAIQEALNASSLPFTSPRP